MPKYQVKYECTYFNQSMPCSLCGARPVMRKTGKCAPHSVDPFDFTRENDWIDCYRGCLKHDPQARKKVNERLRPKSDKPKVRAKRVTNKQKASIDMSNFSPLPTIDTLFLLHRSSAETREQELTTIMAEAIKSRKIGYSKIAHDFGASSTSRDYFRNRLNTFGPRHKLVKLSFMDVCDLIDYLRAFDKTIKEGQTE